MVFLSYSSHPPISYFYRIPVFLWESDIPLGVPLGIPLGISLGIPLGGQRIQEQGYIPIVSYSFIPLEIP